MENWNREWKWYCQKGSEKVLTTKTSRNEEVRGGKWWEEKLTHVCKYVCMYACRDVWVCALFKCVGTGKIIKVWIADFRFFSFAKRAKTIRKLSFKQTLHKKHQGGANGSGSGSGSGSSDNGPFALCGCQICVISIKRQPKGFPYRLVFLPFYQPSRSHSLSPSLSTTLLAVNTIIFSFAETHAD